jgi:hypothetical protein
MSHAGPILALLFQSPQEIQEIGEWGRKITEVYMNWYTFFVTANLLVMGWFFSKDVKNHKPLLPVSALFLSLNILGAFSTGLVGWYMASEVPPHFRGLVGWAAAVTAAALLGVGSIWVYLMRTIVKSHKEASVAR